MKVVAKIGDMVLRRGFMVRHLTTGKTHEFCGVVRSNGAFWLVMKDSESYRGPSHWVPSVFGAAIHADKVV